MRRAERQVRDEKEIRYILDRCQVCRLAMVEEGIPYILPLSFGYCLEQGRLQLYFHSAREGRKIRLLRQTPRVGFEMDCGHSLLKGDTACSHSFAYASVIGQGRAAFLEDPLQKASGLQIIMRQQTGQADWPELYEQDLSKVAVFTVTADRFSVKANRPNFAQQ